MTADPTPVPLPPAGTLVTVDLPSVPSTEFEVIARLKAPPQDVKVTVSIDNEYSPPVVRHWVALHYRFRGKLGYFGTWLKKVSDDVAQAGGYVIGFNISDACNLRPKNESPDDYTPDGDWECMFVVVKIKPKAVVDADRAAWDQALRDLVASHRRPAR